jgi:hypothetical protein
MSEKQPYLPSEDEIMEAQNSMGVEQRLMSAMRDADVSHVLEAGLSQEDLSRISYDERNGSWVVRGHKIEFPGSGVLVIDGKKVDSAVADAFNNKYGEALTVVDNQSNGHYEAHVARTVARNPELQGEIAMENERKAQMESEQKKIDAIATLDALLS